MSSIYLQYCEISINAGSECPQQYRHQITVERTTLETLDSPIPKLNKDDVAQVFSLGLSVVILFFLVGRGIGAVLELIRKG
ncbi:MAG: hypothetical protein ACTJHW_07910 [Paenalcaligenes sp.]